MKRSHSTLYSIGIALSVLLVIVLSQPAFHSFRMAGALHHGHETLACFECHQPAAGTLRQQVQTNVYYFLGLRTESVAFNFETPNNKDCLACHTRENDRHPVYRFNEPRFKKARHAIQPQYCQSCHQQHQATMFTAKIQYCRHCHQTLTLKNDPLAPTHQTLIEQKKWQRCLLCHDFHGNHRMQIPTTTDAMMNKDKLTTYLQGNANSDPYTNKKITAAKKTRNKP